MSDEVNVNGIIVTVPVYRDSPSPSRVTIRRAFDPLNLPGWDEQLSIGAALALGNAIIAAAMSAQAQDARRNVS